jgi:hypothetical protein
LSGVTIIFTPAAKRWHRVALGPVLYAALETSGFGALGHPHDHFKLVITFKRIVTKWRRFSGWVSMIAVA